MNGCHLTVFGILAATSGFVHAECREPKPPETIPDGSSATPREIRLAGKAIRAYSEQVDDYLICLESEASQAKVGADADTWAALHNARIAAHNAAVDRAIGITNCFNVELREFKASGGGQGARAADCTEHLEAAERGAEPNARKTTDVVETTGGTFALESGSWSYFLRTGGELVRCGYQDRPECNLNRLYVRNSSNASLECHGRLTYAAPNIDGALVVERAGVLTPRSEKPVIKDFSKPEVRPSGFEMDCTPRPPLSPLPTASECRFTITRAVDLTDYYPAAARRIGQEGPVVVEFTLKKPEGKPSDIVVAEGSLSERLDKAAVRAAGDMRMSTSCPDQRYRLLLRFEIYE